MKKGMVLLLALGGYWAVTNLWKAEPPPEPVPTTAPNHYRYIHPPDARDTGAAMQYCKSMGNVNALYEAITRLPVNFESPSLDYVTVTELIDYTKEARNQTEDIHARSFFSAFESYCERLRDRSPIGYLGEAGRRMRDAEYAFHQH